MGIIRVGLAAAGGALADQWLETIEPISMDNTILATYGTTVRQDGKRNKNKRGTQDLISNGSIIHVPENTFMLLTDGGKIVAATDEAGYYQVDNSRSPSVFFTSTEAITIEGYHNTNEAVIERPGGIKNTIQDTFERFKFGGSTPLKQQVVYINKMEIPSIRFGTRNPVPYTDRVLIPGRVVPCKLTSFGTYSIKVSDPILFYRELVDKQSKTTLKVNDLAEQYLNEFLSAYQTALAKLSMDLVMVNDIVMHTQALGRYMADALDDEWMENRGFFIASVGIAGINFDEATSALLEQYAKDSILMDPQARAARMAGSVAKGIESAGANENGAMMGFAGINMGMNAVGGIGEVMNPSTSQAHGQSMHHPQPVNQQNQNNPYNQQTQTNNQNNGQQGGWTCQAGHVNPESSKFCSECGQKRVVATYACSHCGWEPADKTNPPKFCPNCGDPFNDGDRE